MAPKQILDQGLIAGMDVVGARFKNNEIYIYTEDRGRDRFSMIKFE